MDGYEFQSHFYVTYKAFFCHLLWLMDSLLQNILTVDSHTITVHVFCNNV